MCFALLKLERVGLVSEEVEALLTDLSRQLDELTAVVSRLTQEPLGSLLLATDIGSAANQTFPNRVPSLPDPRLIRRILRNRRLRDKYFDAQLFADPAWDMLLDLAAARVEHIRVSVTSLCMASGVPPTTALRWIGQLEKMGLVVRVEDEADRRRAFLDLSDPAVASIARYFSDVGLNPAAIL